MPTCPECKSEYPETVPECPACAAAAEVEYRCGECGTEYRGADACPACGALRLDVPCEDHPERSATGRCVVCGRAVCDDCHADDARACLCSDHHEVAVIQGWAQVYTTTTEFEAQLVRDNLRAEGIDAQVYSQKDSAFTVDLGELSIVRVLVPVWEYERAVQLIESHQDSEGEVVFACPACGEPYDAGATECVSCGAALV